jgi:hypothetical protein
VDKALEEVDENDSRSAKGLTPAAVITALQRHTLEAEDVLSTVDEVTGCVLNMPSSPV